MRSYFHSNMSFTAYIPNVQMRKRRRREWLSAHHKNLLDVCLRFCQIHLVEFLFSIITEVLLSRTSSLSFLLISKLDKMWVFFFLFAFSTFSFHDLKKKKKKVSTSWAGLKAAVCNVIWDLDCHQRNGGVGFSKHISTVFPSGNWFISSETLEDVELTVRFLNYWMSDGKMAVICVRRGNGELVEFFFTLKFKHHFNISCI